jgi:hypothetical protein
MDGLNWTPVLALVVLLANGATAGCSDDGGTSGSPATAGSSATAGSPPIGGNSGVAGSGVGGASAGAPAGGHSGNATAGVGGGTAGSSAGGTGAGPRGALSLNVATGAGCKLTAGFVDIPQVASGHPVSATGATNAVADNTMTDAGLVRVRCQMQGGILDASIRNELTGQNADVTTVFPTASPEFAAFNATIQAGQTNYSGTEGVPCAMTVLKSTANSVLVQFNCPTFVPVDGSDGTCVLNESYAYFEGCTN